MKDIEELMAEKPDYVLKKFLKWFQSIPKDERDRPMTGSTRTVYSPKQVFDEVMSTLKMDPIFKKRCRVIKDMSNVSKNLLKEIMLAKKK